MLSIEQWKDIFEGNRVDVVEEIFEQYADLFEKFESQVELYKNAPTELLYKLTVNGDESACAYYIRRRINEDTLVAKDVEYLKGAIYNFGFEAALVGSWLFGMKDCIYKDPLMEYISNVVLEQHGNKEAHKLLTKAYKKNRETVQKAEEKILYHAIDQWAAGAIRGETLALRVDVHGMDKTDSHLDYKTGYITEISLTETTDRETEADELFVSYARGKKREEDLNRLTDNLTNALVAVADKMRIPSLDISVNGRRVYHYGGGGQAKQANKQSDTVNIISDAELNVNVSDETLVGNVCPNCGGELDENGVCISCGYKREGKSGNEIHIKRSQDTEAMICTQCGSPVVLEADGKTAFCSACGTTFIINGNALKFEIPGLNYENIRADMPEGATLPDVKFVRAAVADNRVTAIMPKNFIVMPEEMRRIKYRANAPKYIYTTPDSTVNLNLNIVGALKEEDVFAYGQQMLSALKGIYPGAKFGEAQRFTRKRNIFMIDFITQGADQSIYNAMFFFSFGGQQGIGSWNCLGKDRWYWAPVFEHAVKTMEFKD
ncbi:MAG: DUF1272 domain-containing protein [Clostridiales bacterium]|nr:DUF1272 domain-containing protein [Clostridiales bacterium]